MSLDTRIISPSKVVELVVEKINTENFNCSYTSYLTNQDKNQNIQLNSYLFLIRHNFTDYFFCYQYKADDYRIKEINKLVKRKNIECLEEFLAKDIFNKFMNDWIYKAKK